MICPRRDSQEAGCPAGPRPGQREQRGQLCRAASPWGPREVAAGVVAPAVTLGLMDEAGEAGSGLVLASRLPEQSACGDTQADSSPGGVLVSPHSRPCHVPPGILPVCRGTPHGHGVCRGEPRPEGLGRLSLQSHLSPPPTLALFSHGRCQPEPSPRPDLTDSPLNVGTNTDSGGSPAKCVFAVVLRTICGPECVTDVPSGGRGDARAPQSKQGRRGSRAGARSEGLGRGFRPGETLVCS